MYCEVSSGTEEVGSGCYLTLIARAMNPGLAVIQKCYVPGRDIGIEHLRQGHYIGGDEKKGFTISEMDISLPDQRLKLFVRGRTDWRVENIGKKVKKSKRGRLIEGTSASAQQEDLEETFHRQVLLIGGMNFKVHQVDRDPRKDG